jgi:hypothetical protein
VEEIDEDDGEDNVSFFLSYTFAFVIVSGDENMGGLEPHMIVAHQSLVSFH